MRFVPPQAPAAAALTLALVPATAGAAAAEPRMTLIGRLAGGRS